MREELKKIEGARDIFSGRFEKIKLRTRNNRKRRRILLFKDIRDRDGKIVASHMWFNLTSGFKSLGLCKGDVIEFRARVKRYARGCCGKVKEKHLQNPNMFDFGLAYPRKIKLVTQVIAEAILKRTDSEITIINLVEEEAITIKANETNVIPKKKLLNWQIKFLQKIRREKAIELLMQRT